MIHLPVITAVDADFEGGLSRVGDLGFMSSFPRDPESAIRGSAMDPVSVES